MGNKNKISACKKLTRLHVVLARAGIASRRESEKIIAQGRITVNGKVVATQGVKVDSSGSRIELDGEPIIETREKYYFIFHKPKGVTTTVKDKHARKKVVDYFKAVDARLYPVGRLDKDTTGLLFLTNDGELAYRLSHPRFGVEKEYMVFLDEGIEPQEIKRLESGVDIDGKRTAQCRIESLDGRRSARRLRVVIHEGRKRQIRLIFLKGGRRVTSLKRLRYGNLRLGTLAEGKYRRLSKKELSGLKGLVRIS